MVKVRDGLVKRGKTWSYVVRVRDPDTGRSKQKWVGGFRTEGAARAARDEARFKARRGEFVGRNQITVGQYLDEWIEAHGVEIKPKTLDGYRYLIERYIKPRIGRDQLQAVRPATVTRLYRELHESGGRDGRPLSARTVEYVHALLRKAFNDAVEIERLLSSNPVERAKRPRREPFTPGRVWSPAQLSAFLDEARGHRLYAFFHLAAHTGARRGELLNLRWADVDLDQAEIRIAGSAAVIAGQRVEGTTKGGRGRTISIDAGTVQVLRQHRAQQVAERLIVGTDWLGGDYLFTTGFGAPIYPCTVTQLMPKLIAAHNRKAPSEPLPPARLHDLRHIHATTLQMSDVAVGASFGRVRDHGLIWGLGFWLRALVA